MKSQASFGLLAFVWWSSFFLAFGVTLDDPANYRVRNIWNGNSLGLPDPLGGIFFSQDGNTLYVVGASESVSSALYSLAVHRDSASGAVTNLGPATLVFLGNPNTRGLDTGFEFGPEGTLFYTYYPSHILAQRPGGFTGAEQQYFMSSLGLPSSIAGLSFSPHLIDTNSSFALLQCSTWLGDGLYNVWIQPRGGGLFEPVAVERFVTLPRQGTGAFQYFPSGPLQGHIMYVNWDFGEVMILFIDPATGLPYDEITGLPTKGTSAPIVTRIAHDLGVGPWGIEFDPVTLDIFVTTWGGSPANSIVQIAQTGLPTKLTTRVMAFTKVAGDGFRIRWYGPPGWTHRVVQADSIDSANWHSIHSVTNAPFDNEFVITGNSSTAYFRIEAVSPN